MLFFSKCRHTQVIPFLLKSKLPIASMFIVAMSTVLQSGLSVLVCDTCAFQKKIENLVHFSDFKSGQLVKALDQVSHSHLFKCRFCLQSGLSVLVCDTCAFQKKIENLVHFSDFKSGQLVKALDQVSHSHLFKCRFCLYAGTQQ